MKLQIGGFLKERENVAVRKEIKFRGDLYGDAFCLGIRLAGGGAGAA